VAVVEHIQQTVADCQADRVVVVVINLLMVAQEHKAQADQQPVMDSQEEEVVKHGLAPAVAALVALAEVVEEF
jgi:Flp pilus assembly protein protease CpaA